MAKTIEVVIDAIEFESAKYQTLMFNKLKASGIPLIKRNVFDISDWTDIYVTKGNLYQNNLIGGGVQFVWIG